MCSLGNFHLFLAEKGYGYSPPPEFEKSKVHHGLGDSLAIDAFLIVAAQRHQKEGPLLPPELDFVGSDGLPESGTLLGGDVPAVGSGFVGGGSVDSTGPRRLVGLEPGGLHIVAGPFSGAVVAEGLVMRSGSNGTDPRLDRAIVHGQSRGRQEGKDAVLGQKGQYFVVLEF